MQVALLVFAPLCLAADVDIRVVKDGDEQPIAFEVTGLSPQELAQLREADDAARASMFSVNVLSAGGEAQRPAIAGKYSVDGNVLRFTPSFPLRPGLTYLASFQSAPSGPAASPRVVKRTLSLPAAKLGPRAKVTAIFPSAEVLPDNQLRFYVHFSAPMSRGNVYEHIKLLDDAGKPIERAFLEIGEELWDRSGQRLTLLFDPGRVKRGLKPREEFGPVLEAGRKYTLVVNQRLEDAHGRSLGERFEKPITAGPPIESPLDPGDWKIEPPPAGTRDPLVIRFPHPLDRALLGWTIDVQNSAKQALAGDVAISDQERQWEFRPSEAWIAGAYELTIDTTLEDTAGNRIGRPFEVDVFDKVDSSTVPQYVRIPFTVGSSSRP